VPPHRVNALYPGSSDGLGAVTLVTEEHKTVTVLFCDLVGFTAASDRADPEDVRARIRPYHARLRREVEGFGGTVEKFIGARAGAGDARAVPLLTELEKYAWEHAHALLGHGQPCPHRNRRVPGPGDRADRITGVFDSSY
jgi:class 3 adenylate cyclase